MLGEGDREREKPRDLDTGLDEGQSPQLTWGEGDTSAALTRLHGVAAQWRVPVMERVCLNNLQGYLTVIYTTPCPGRGCAVHWTESGPLGEFCWFPFKLWLMSQMWKKLVVGW